MKKHALDITIDEVVREISIMELGTLIGLTLNEEALKTTGTLLSWYQVLTLGGIVLAISEFMERDKLRTYVFKFGNLSKNVFELIILSFLLIIFANLSPLFDHRPFVIPLLHYPTFWELMSLFAFTCAILLIIVFSLSPFIFMPRFSRSKSGPLVRNIHSTILRDNSLESLSAISMIIRKNLGGIFNYASKYDRDWNIQGSSRKSPYEREEVSKRDRNLVDYSLHLIDIAMSDKFFCQYLARHNIGLLLGIIKKTNQYKLWNSCGYIFYNSLCKELFTDDESHLSRELEFRGVGIHKPVFNSLFTSLNILESYRPFQTVGWWQDKNINVSVINKYTEALAIALRGYFKEERCIFIAGTANTALSVALRHLAGVLRTICIRIGKYDNDDIYRNQFGDVIMSIEGFFGRGSNSLGECLSGSQDYAPRFSKEDLTLDENSLTVGITEAIFEYLDALTSLEHDHYARHLSTALFWLIYPVSKDRPEVVTNMEERLLTLLRERVEENKKGWYSSMIKLLINIYGFQFHSGVPDNVRIGQYIEKEFKENLAKGILEDESKQKRYLPQNYIVDREQHLIKHSNEKIIYHR